MLLPEVLVDASRRWYNSGVCLKSNSYGGSKNELSTPKDKYHNTEP